MPMKAEIKRTLVFIVNPAAKNGQALKMWRNLKERLAEIPHTALLTQYKGHATKLAEEAASNQVEPLLIVAVGGDGTIHEVINGVVGCPHVTVAYIPAGSGNDFARGFKLPTKANKSIETILELLNAPGNLYDAGFFEGSGEKGYFVNSLGAGFDAVISKKANEAWLKKWLGKGIYAFYLLVELFRYPTSKLELIIDGESHIFERTWFVTVSNQPFYGGGMIIAPNANPDDGMLNVFVASELSKVKLLLVFMTVFWGGHTRFKEVNTFLAKKVTIKFSDAVPVHADGEEAGITPVCVEIKCNCWRIMNGKS